MELLYIKLSIDHSLRIRVDAYASEFLRGISIEVMAFIRLIHACSLQKVGLLIRLEDIVPSTVLSNAGDFL